MHKNKNQIEFGERRAVWFAKTGAEMAKVVATEIKKQEGIEENDWTSKEALKKLAEKFENKKEIIHQSRDEQKALLYKISQFIKIDRQFNKGSSEFHAVEALLKMEIEREETDKFSEKTKDAANNDFEGSNKKAIIKIEQAVQKIATEGKLTDKQTSLLEWEALNKVEAAATGADDPIFENTKRKKYYLETVTEAEIEKIIDFLEVKAKEIKISDYKSARLTSLEPAAPKLQQPEKTAPAPAEVSAVGDLLGQLETKENKDIVESTLDSVETEITEQNLGLNIDRQAFKDAAMQIAATELASLRKADENIPATKDLIELQKLNNQKKQLELRRKKNDRSGKFSLAIATPKVQEAIRKQGMESKKIGEAIKSKEAEIKESTAYRELAKSTSLKINTFTLFEHSKVKDRAKDLQKKIEARVTTELIEPAKKILPEIEKLKREGLNLPTDKKLSTTEIIKAVGDAQGIVAVRDGKIQPVFVTEYLAKNNNVIENIKGIFIEKLWDVKLKSNIDNFATGLGLTASAKREDVIALLKKTDIKKLSKLQSSLGKVGELKDILKQAFPKSGDLMKDPKVLTALQGLVGVDFAKDGKLDVTILINMEEAELVMLDTNLDHLIPAAKKIALLQAVFSGNKEKEGNKGAMKELIDKMDIKSELPKILENPEQAEGLIIKKAQKILGIENKALISIEDLQNFIQTQIEKTKESLKKHQKTLTELFAHINPQLDKFGATLPSLDSIINSEKDNKQYSFEELVQVLQTREISEVMLVGGILEKLGLTEKFKAKTTEGLKKEFDEYIKKIDEQLDAGIATLIKKGIPAFMSEKFKLGKKDQAELENIELDPATLDKLKQQFLPLISDFLKQDNPEKFAEGIINANGVINIKLAMQALNDPKIKKLSELSKNGDLEKTLAKGEKEFGSDEEGKNEKAVKDMVGDMSKLIMKGDTPATKEIHAAVSEKIPVTIKGKIAISEVKGAFNEAIDAWKEKGGLEGIFAAITIFFSKFGEIFGKITDMFKGVVSKVKKPFVNTAEKVCNALGEHAPEALKEPVEKERKPLKDSLRETFRFDEASVSNISKNEKLTMEVLMNPKTDLAKIKAEHGINANADLAGLVQHIQTNEAEKYISKDHSKQNVWDFLKERSPSYFPVKKVEASTPEAAPVVEAGEPKPDEKNAGIPEAAKKIIKQMGTDSAASK
jgi:hypothetical protein